MTPGEGTFSALIALFASGPLDANRNSRFKLRNRTAIHLLFR